MRCWLGSWSFSLAGRLGSTDNGSWVSSASVTNSANAARGAGCAGRPASGIGRRRWCSWRRRRWSSGPRSQISPVTSRGSPGLQFVELSGVTARMLAWACRARRSRRWNGPSRALKSRRVTVSDFTGGSRRVGRGPSWRSCWSCGRSSPRSRHASRRSAPTGQVRCRIAFPGGCRQIGDWPSRAHAASASSVRSSSHWISWSRVLTPSTREIPSLCSLTRNAAAAHAVESA
jgi:hypothetical protein